MKWNETPKSTAASQIVQTKSGSIGRTLRLLSPLTITQADTVQVKARQRPDQSCSDRKFKRAAVRTYRSARQRSSSLATPRPIRTSRDFLEYGGSEQAVCALVGTRQLCCSVSHSLKHASHKGQQYALVEREHASRSNFVRQ